MLEGLVVLEEGLVLEELLVLEEGLVLEEPLVLGGGLGEGVDRESGVRSQKY